MWIFAAPGVKNFKKCLVNIKVYLDIFHAVKRISSTISKKHPLHYECIRSLSMVFRDRTDHGNVRQKPTPSPTVLRENMVSYFKSSGSMGRMFCPLQPIRRYLDCASTLKKGIKPGRGTNKNEALYKSLNAHMKASRYGVELAYMLLTTSFYQHNERVDAKNNQSPCKLIMEHVDCLQTLPWRDESFGIIPIHMHVSATVGCISIRNTHLRQKYLLVRFTSTDICTASLSLPHKI